MHPLSDKHAGDARSRVLATTTRRWRTERPPVANGGEPSCMVMLGKLMQRAAVVDQLAEFCR